MKRKFVKMLLNTAITAIIIGGGILLDDKYEMPVFAESPAAVPGASGEQTDVASVQTVTVEGLKAGSTAKIYQIVDGYYKDDKLVKYVLMDSINAPIAAIGDESRGQTQNSDNDIITEDEITTIANNIQNGAFTADKGVDMSVGTTADADGLVSATASVEPGLYLVLATDPSGETVYNPAVVAVNITDVNNNTAKGSSVNMTKFFTFKDAKNVYLKSSSSTMDLTITGSDKAAAEAEGDTTGKKDPVNSYGDTVAQGDTVHFQIGGMTIPSFSADYTNPQYIITDTLDSAFEAYTNLKISVGGTDITEPSVQPASNALTPSDTTSKYTIEANGSGFKITFTKEYLNALRGTSAENRAVKVTFDSVLSKPAYNFAENHNRATVQYSNNPSDASALRTINKDTYNYTFAIDSSIDSQNPNSKTTYEFNKVTAANAGFENQKSKSPLAGAAFTLYRNEDCTEVAKTADQTDGTAVSDEDGHISFTGLDEGTYYMKETAAPANYTLTDQTYKFVIQATLRDDDGVLTGYTVKTQYKDAANTDWTDAGTATYTATATKTDDGAVTNNVIDRTDAPIEIVNTKLQALPSTGGVGIVLIIGIAAAFGVAGVALSRKGKKQ